MSKVKEILKFIKYNLKNILMMLPICGILVLAGTVLIGSFINCILTLFFVLITILACFSFIFGLSEMI